MTRRAMRMAAAVAAALAATAACSGSPSPDPGTDPTALRSSQQRTTYVPNPPPIQVEKRTLQLGAQRLTVPVPTGAEVDPVETIQVGDCAVLVLRVPTAVDGDVEIASVPSGCDLGRQRALKGTIGYYRSPADMDAAGAFELQATALGPAQVGTLDYTECTNRCSSVDLPIALITLDAPVDPSRPTLQVLDDLSPANGERPELDFADYLDRIAAP